MSAMLSRYLKDFSAPKVELSLMPPKYFPDLDADYADGDRLGARPAMPEIDIDAERRRAFAEGRAEATAELVFEQEKQIAELQAAHAAELEALRLRLEEEAANRLAERFAEMADSLAIALGDQTARVLAPVMEDALMQRAVADMAQMLKQGLVAGEGCTIVIKGPGHLFEALKRQLGEDMPLFRHIETDDVDLSVEMDGTILVTRMAAWADTVRKVLA
ncbi:MULTISPECIES: hypothetical protein [unclassified Ensifer]|uniref:hypothetical protein n=1 Tax=unclassified Ensifer TaxID=2633371 RepID=UPI00081370B3|nr:MULTISPECIES: hypothetical protein [unclassified Ensifer]OCP04932.1 hypothetical protein BC362_14300 [Ensifer sp. LC14]OCP08654.1 hypothetical protein BBX50_19100 [Ensifer sp. LC11]OCP09913.1 hypothetical protein BC374_18895 [Ensifer sp. LC13]OCP33128.1 hypothetical protein BC364_18630 [Ensifer sp. LC499]